MEVGRGVSDLPPPAALSALDSRVTALQGVSLYTEYVTGIGENIWTMSRRIDIPTKICKIRFAVQGGMGSNLWVQISVHPRIMLILD